MAHDELDMARRFQADLRKLLKQYPTLTTAEAQARLNGYMCKQIDTEENVMPTKDHRSLGEDLVPLAVRIPVSIIPDIDAHVARMRRQHRYMRIGRSDALRDLIIRACDAIAAEEAAHVPFSPAAVPSTPPQEETREESFPREAELDARYNALKATLKEEIHTNAGQPVEPSASMPTPVSHPDDRVSHSDTSVFHPDTTEDTFTVDLDTDATEDDQAAALQAVSKELSAAQGHIAKMHDVIEAMPEGTDPVESVATAAVLPTVTKPSPAKAKSRARNRKGAAK